MNEIRCPHCGKVFQVDESGYTQLLKQVRDAEFERDMAERERLLDAAHRSAVQAAETRVRAEGERALAERDGKIAQLQAQLERQGDAVNLARVTAEREAAERAARRAEEQRQQVSERDARIAELEQQRRNLLFLVCRILQAAPGYRLRPSELAVGNVGDLSCLGQETYASLLNRMERDYPARTSKEGTSQATPCCPFLCRAGK